VLLATPLGRLRAALPPGSAAASGRLTVAVRPEKVRLLPAMEPGENRVEAVVERIIYGGNASLYHLRCGEVHLTAEAMNTAPAANPHPPGQRLAVELPFASLIVLED